MKKIILVVVVIVLAGAVGFMVWDGTRNNEEPEHTEQQQSESEQQDESATDTEQEVADVEEVDIKDFAFQSAEITVPAGTTVVWENSDDAQHTVTPDADSDEFQDSGLLSKGESYSVTFMTPGTYKYHCTPHPNMTGTVTVTE